MKQVSALVTLSFIMKDNDKAQEKLDYVTQLVNEIMASSDWENQPEIDITAPMVITSIVPMIDPTDLPSDLVTLEKVNVWKQIANDFEDDGFVHIDAWTSEDGDEGGKVIAKVSIETGDVTYLDERAKYEVNAQEAINEAVLYSTKKGLE